MPFVSGVGGHDVASFDSGQPALDRWLRRFAGQGQRRDASRTYVVVDVDERVVGYYTLVSTEIPFPRATSAVQRGMSRHYPIPAVRLVRLAVDHRHQGVGLGAGLLQDALATVLRTADRVGTRAVIVDAIDENAARFYRRFGFAPLADDGLTLMSTVAALRSAAVAAVPATTSRGDDASTEGEAEQDWYPLFATLGAWGFRPRRISGGVVAYGRDDVTVVVREAEDPQADDEAVVEVEVLGPDGRVAAPARLWGGATPREVVEIVCRMVGPGGGNDEPPSPRDPATSGGDDAFARVEIAMAYAAYRPELDALASVGIHAYVTSGHGSGVRIACEIGEGLRLDVSIMDDDLPPTGPSPGYWLVILETADGLIAEYGVERGAGRAPDAVALATAVRDGLHQVLRGGRILMGQLDGITNRVDTGLYDLG